LSISPLNLFQNALFNGPFKGAQKNRSAKLYGFSDSPMHGLNSHFFKPCLSLHQHQVLDGILAKFLTEHIQNLGFVQV